MTPGNAMAWIGRALSEPDGTPSTRRTLFVIAVAFALGLATGALYVQRALTAEISGLVETVVWATAAALGFGKFAEAAK